MPPHRAPAELSTSSGKRLRRRPCILQVVSHLALGGAERIAAAIATAPTDAFSFAFHAVRGVGDGAVGESLRREILARDIPLHLGPRVPMRFGGMLTGAFALARTLRATQPDLIHLHTEIPESSYAVLLALRPRLRSIPVVRTIHNSVIWHFSPQLGRWCDRRLAHAALACVSPGALAAFSKLRQRSGAPPPPFPPAVILNGVHPPRVREPVIRPADAPLELVFGGRLEHEKGADLIPEILQQTPLPAGRRANFHIFGSGAHAATLRNLARHPPPSWHVNLHAPIPDFAQHLHRYDVLVMPSRHEGLGLVAIEAALAGLPVVATDAPGLRDVFPSDYPLLARAGDPTSIAQTLGIALAQPETATRAARLAQAFAQKHFDAATMIQHYRDLYSRVLASAPSAT